MHQNALIKGIKIFVFHVIRDFEFWKLIDYFRFQFDSSLSDGPTKIIWSIHNLEVVLESANLFNVKSLTFSRLRLQTNKSLSQFSKFGIRIANIKGKIGLPPIIKFFGTIVGWSKRKGRKTGSVFPNVFQFLFNFAPRLAAKDVGK